jgi:hypothetical protein
MTERIAEASPRLKARVAGVLYLLIFVAAPFAEFFVRGRLVISGDPAATATNILAHELLFRLGFVAELITLVCDTTVALIFYDLLKPVSRSLSLLAAFFRLMLVAIMAVDSLNYFSPLVLLGGAHFLTAFKADQLQGLVLVSQSLFTHGYNISLVFFGFHCLLIGYLIYRSTFLPRIIGVLLAIGGPCYVTNSLASFLSPGFAAPYLLIPPGLGELSLTLWLLVVGVNVQRWKEQASAAGASIRI